jgi:hypothetical protein
MPPALHRVERMGHHIERVRLTRAHRVADQEIERHARRELWRATKAGVTRVESARQGAERQVQRALVNDL